jgi:outer membrane lipoprotein carrier protein
MTERFRAPRLRSMLVACSLLLAPALAAAQTALDTYVEGLTSWSASFSQRTEDDRGRRLEIKAGKLTIVKPGRFRWEVGPAAGKPPETLMIADGVNLWQLDYDLEQATVKPQTAELGQSPIMLLAGSAELRTLFTVTADGRRDGLDWVKVVPKQPESDFREASFGFKGRELSRLVFTDKLGGRTTLTFSDVRRNDAVDPALLRFTKPEGVDLIGTPVTP